MLRMYYQKYKPKYSDKNSQSTAIIIDIMDSSSSKTTMTVNYKLKDKWKFNVGGGLTINNVIFNAIDSIITDTDTNNYLKTETNGCSYSDSIFLTQGSTTDCNIKYPL